MSITADILRGHTDTIILAQLIQGDSYGYEINKAVRKQTDGLYELKEATLYTAFRRLEENGCIRSYWGDANAGARRRYYAITDQGRRCYASLLRDWEQARSLIDTLVYTEDR